MIKKILLAAAAAAIMAVPCVYAETAAGWNIDNAGSGIAQICEENVYEGEKALHVSGVGGDGDITVTRPMSEIESVQRIYRVTFYAKGDYNEDNIMVGWGDRTSSTNNDVISLMSLSHEKVEKSSASDGWTRYTYIVRQKTANNSDFKLIFKEDSGDIYIDAITVVFDGVLNQDRDTSGYLCGGQGIFDGGFEDAVTEETGDNLEDYGWSAKAVNTSGLTAAAGDKVESIARVVYSEDGNRRLYVKFNSLEKADETKAFVLTKKVNIPDSEFYVTFRMKGAYLPSSVMVAGNNDSRYQALAGGSGSSFDNYYGTYVTAAEEENGWIRYKVRTGGNGDVLRIKIYSGCLGVYIDDFSIENDEGTEISIDNGDFDTVYYDSTERFAEDWTGESVNSKAFVQRVIFNKNPAVYMQTKEKRVGFSQKLELDPSEEYIISFEAFAEKGTNSLTAGFGNDIAGFKGTSQREMEKEKLGKGRTRYTFRAKGSGNYFIIASDGVCGGVYIDNVSVKDAEGKELTVNGDFSEKEKPAAYTVSQYKLYKDKSEVEYIESGNFKVAVSAENNFCEPNREFTLILCHVRDGELIKYNMKSITLSPNGEEDDPTALECEINLSDCASTDTLEVYLWDNISDMNSLRSFCVYNTL